MSARQVVTGVTPALAVATSSALTSASATKDSTEMDILVLVGKGCVISTLAGQAEGLTGRGTCAITRLFQQHLGTQHSPLSVFIVYRR